MHAMQDAHCAREGSQPPPRERTDQECEPYPQANSSIAENMTVVCKPVCQVDRKSNHIGTKKRERVCKPPLPLSMMFETASSTAAETYATTTGRAEHATASVASRHLINNRRRSNHRRVCEDDDKCRLPPSTADNRHVRGETMTIWRGFQSRKYRQERKAGWQAASSV